MAKFLLKVSYTAEGTKGVLKEGGTGRRKAVEQMLQSTDVKLEAFYYAFGDDDAYLIVDAPNMTTLMAISMSVAAAGGARVSTVPLFSPEEVDQATKKNVSYRAPGA